MSNKLTIEQAVGVFGVAKEQVKKMMKESSVDAAYRCSGELARGASDIPREDGSRVGSYMGQYQNSFHPQKNAAGDSIVLNDAPHSTVIENGAAPHGMSADGYRALERWAMLRLGKTEQEAKGVAFLVAQKLRHHGQEPTFYVRKYMPRAADLWRREFERKLTALKAEIDKAVK